MARPLWSRYWSTCLQSYNKPVAPGLKSLEVDRGHPPLPMRTALLLSWEAITDHHTTCAHACYDKFWVHRYWCHPIFEAVTRRWGAWCIRGRAVREHQRRSTVGLSGNLRDEHTVKLLAGKRWPTGINRWFPVLSAAHSTGDWGWYLDCVFKFITFLW